MTPNPFNAQFFKALLQVSENNLLATAQVLSQRGDLAAMQGLVDCLNDVDGMLTLLQTNEPLSITYKVGFVNEPATGNSEFTQVFARSIRPGVDANGHVGAHGHALLDRVIDLYAKQPEPDRLLEALLHDCANLVQDTSVHAKVLDAMTTSANGHHGFDERSAFMAAASKGQFDVATLVARRTEASIVWRDVREVIENATGEPFNHANPKQVVVRCMPDKVLTHPESVRGFLDGLERTFDSADQPVYLDDEDRWPIDDVCKFRMVAATAYLAACLRDNVSWDADALECIVGCDLDDVEHSRMAQVLTNFAHNASSANDLDEDDVSDDHEAGIDLWASSSFGGSGAVPSYMQPELHFFQAVLASHCTPLLPMFKELAHISAEEGGPGLESVVHFDHALVRYGRNMGDKVAPAFDARRFEQTVRFLNENGHGMHQPLRGLDAPDQLVMNVCARTEEQHMARALPVLLAMGAEPARASSGGTRPDQEESLLADPSKLGRWTSIVKSFQSKRQAESIFAELNTNNDPLPRP